MEMEAGGGDIMKKLVATLLLAVMIVSAAGCGSTKGELDHEGAFREFDPDDTSVYIDDGYTALISSVENANMTDAEKQRCAELRAMAVDALELVNRQRTAAGLPALVWSDELAVAADVRANDEMVRSFSHTRPNGSEYWTVNSDIIWGENLAKGYNTSEGVVAAWMASPTHAANILDAGFVTCGIAIYEDADGKLYWAQEFGY